jgi:serine/threonine protein phosphatase PrpC
MSASTTKHDMGFSYRLYRLLLRCYPAQFHRMYAQEMARTFRDSYRAAMQQQGRSSVLHLWGIVLYDLGVSLFIEYRSAFKELLDPIEERHGKNYMSITNVVFAQRSDIGLKRQLNEDSVISIQPEDQQVMERKGILFVVADGMGGHTRGEVASQLAVNTIRDVYYQQESDDLAALLRLAVEQANARIYNENTAISPKPEPDQMMGTTCVAAAVQGDTLYVANVGDSRAYIVRNGQAQQISLDHSVVAQQLRDGLITKEQAKDHPDRNKIYRCLGERDVVEVDTFSAKVQAGDLLLLCTDGLSELVPEEEVVSIVQQYEPQESVQRLIERANEMGGRDNITAVVARVA